MSAAFSVPRESPLSCRGRGHLVCINDRTIKPTNRHMTELQSAPRPAPSAPRLRLLLRIEWISLAGLPLRCFSRIRQHRHLIAAASCRLCSPAAFIRFEIQGDLKTSRRCLAYDTGRQEMGEHKFSILLMTQNEG